jgi:hypothetical protein
MRAAGVEALAEQVMEQIPLHACDENMAATGKNGFDEMT